MQQDFGLVVDWETSGLPDQDVPWRTYLEGPQGIAIGTILVRLPDFEPIAEFESRVRFLGTAHGISHGGPINEKLTWSQDAERIHGISPKDLLYEPHPVDVAARLISFVKLHTQAVDLSKQPIMMCGHNPAFDVYYMRQLLFLGGLERKLRLHHRMIDSFSLGYFLFGIKSSDDLFFHTSGVHRKIHSAIEDARLTLQALKHIYNLCHGEKLRR